MKYLLDASALLPLITGHGKQLIIEASHENLITTDLAVYEACNSLWKIATLLKTISLEDAVDVADTLKNLIIRNVIHLISLDKLDLPYTLKKAHEEQLTFYDTSYISTAEIAQATLVTDDIKLQKAANKFLKTITYNDLESILRR